MELFLQKLHFFGLELIRNYIHLQTTEQNGKIETLWILMKLANQFVLLCKFQFCCQYSKLLHTSYYSYYWQKWMIKEKILHLDRESDRPTMSTFHNDDYQSIQKRVWHYFHQKQFQNGTFICLQFIPLLTNSLIRDLNEAFFFLP